MLSSLYSNINILTGLPYYVFWQVFTMTIPGIIDVAKDFRGGQTMT